MNLPEDWEKKALIIIGAVFILTVIYAFNPFQDTPTNNTTMEQAPSEPTIIPFPESGDAYAGKYKRKQHQLFCLDRAINQREYSVQNHIYRCRHRKYSNGILNG